MAIRKLAAAACLLALSTTAINAGTFDFMFSANPLLDPSIVSSQDPTAMAVGVLDINVANGSSFGVADVSNVMISVSGDTINDYVVTNFFSISGTVSADGSTASITGNLFASNFSNEFFGCLLAGCADGIVAHDNFSVDIGTQFNSQAAALASFKLDAQISAVPVPAAGLLLLSSLAGFAGLMRHKKRAS